MTGALDRLGAALGSLVERDRALGPLTTYRVGGRASLFVEPPDEDALRAVARAVAAGAPDGAPPVLVVGRGSNLLVSDAGFAGLAIRLGSGFSEVTLEDGSALDGSALDGGLAEGSSGEVIVSAGGAVDLPSLARRTVAAGLTGMEWAVGVPGSVGGAVRMNAGGHGSAMADVIVRCRIVSLADGSARAAAASDLALSYRHSSLVATDVVVSADLRLRRGDPEEGRAAIAAVVRWRRQHQPGGSNAGSVFTNPPGDSAGRVIDACGLKGYRIGSAAVSTKHANFIQCDDGGSADDVARLITSVRERVAAQTGIRLVTEVRMVGFSPAVTPEVVG